MDAAQSTFISSTFWTDRVGPAAALASLNQMQEIRSWELVTDLGNHFRKTMKQVFEQASVEMTLSGLPALTSFTIGKSSQREWKTLLTQEMLKDGYLASTTFYLSTAHNTAIIDRYADRVSAFLSRMKKVGEGKGLADSLEHPLSHSGFSRLN